MREFQPGFRLSRLDGVVLLVGAVVAVVVAQQDVWMGIAVAWVVGHFFLFCNVLRMSRKFEFAWAAVFLACACMAVTRLFSWPTAMIASAVVTIAVAVMEIRKPSYHGVLWERLNPGLRACWEAKFTQAS